MELGGMVYSSLSIRKVASPYLDSLAHSLKATILLGIIKDEHLLYIDKRESESIIRVSSYIGLKRPPYYGMLGMTLVAHMPDEQRKKLLQSYPPEKITGKTVVDVRELLHRFDETKKSGYYVLGACMPVFQVNEKFTQRAIKELTAASASISKELGHK